MKKVGNFKANCTWCNVEYEHELFIDDTIFSHGMTSEEIKLHKKCGECHLFRAVTNDEYDEAYKETYSSIVSWLEAKENQYKVLEEKRIQEEDAERTYQAKMAAVAAAAAVAASSYSSSNISKRSSRSSSRSSNTPSRSSSYSSDDSSDDSSYHSSSSYDYGSSSSSSYSSSDSSSSSSSYDGGSSSGGGCSSDW